MRIHQRARPAIALLALAATATLSRGAESAAIQGGTAASPIDITAHVLAGEAIQLVGGYFVVTVPAAGTAGVVTATAANAYAAADLTNYGARHFVGGSAPSIVYRGAMTGTGTLTVTNATNATSNPGAGASFTGGMLLFTNPQTFWSGSTTPSLVIDPNTVVAFDRGQSPDTGGSFASDAMTPRNVTNNGYLYCYNNYSNITWGDIGATVGAGVVTFENGNILTNGHSYTGAVYVMNGSHVQSKATFAPTNVVQSNIFSFETIGPNYLVGPIAPTWKSVYANDLYTFGADTQVQSNGGQGIQVFTGVALSGSGSTKKDFLPVADSRKLDYFIHGYGGFGLAIYIQATMQLGDGRAIIDNGDGTNNVFIQANVTGGSAFISTGNFEAVPTSLAQASETRLSLSTTAVRITTTRA